MRACQDPAEADRIIVYGVTGSGKSVLAARISQVTGIEHVGVDDLCWRPGWVQVPPEEQRRLVSEVCQRERWLLDSAWGVWSDVALARADVVIALDYPRWVSLGRLLRRTVSRIFFRRPVCNGNTETWAQTFSRESIIAWHFRSFASKRRRIADWQADPTLPPVLRLRRPGETEAWLESLSSSRRRSPGHGRAGAQGTA